MRVWVTVRAGRFCPKRGDYLESNSICKLGDDDLSVPTQLGLGIGRTETWRCQWVVAMSSLNASVGVR